MKISNDMRIHWNEEKKKLTMFFAQELALKLGRTHTDIMSHGLLASDFKDNVKLVYEDGSFSYFRFAFVVRNETHLGVFTEHAGYHMYFLQEFEEIIEKAEFIASTPRNFEDDFDGPSTHDNF